MKNPLEKFVEVLNEDFDDYAYDKDGNIINYQVTLEDALENFMEELHGKLSKLREMLAKNKSNEDDSSDNYHYTDSNSDKIIKISDHKDYKKK